MQKIRKYKYSRRGNENWKIRIPDGITKISRGVFKGCKKLDSISIPEGVTQIGNFAFKNCHNLSSIVLPDSVTQISKSTFIGCDKLVIKGKANSYAQTYAKKLNLRFIAQ